MESDPRPRDPSPEPAERIIAFFEVCFAGVAGYIAIPLLLAAFGYEGRTFLESASMLFLLMILEATTTLMIIAGFMILRGETARAIGLRLVQPGRQVLIGILSLPILFASTVAISAFFHYVLPDLETEQNPILQLIQRPADLLLLLFSSIYIGGIKEEIQRAFILVRFEKYLGGLLPGLIIWSAFFAFGHAVQGVDNAIKAGFLGLIFGLLFIWRRNLIAPITAHAAYDIVTLLAYWNFYIS